MTHYASEGFGFPGGVGEEEFAALHGDPPSEGHIFRVISRPHFLPLPEPLAFTQYSTCFAHNVNLYVANGWKDEGYEAFTEKECIDWIASKPDRSIDVVLDGDPSLPEKIKKIKRAHASHKAEYDEDMDARRGKYI